MNASTVPGVKWHAALNSGLLKPSAPSFLRMYESRHGKTSEQSGMGSGTGLRSPYTDSLSTVGRI